MATHTKYTCDICGNEYGYRELAKIIISIHYYFSHPTTLQAIDTCQDCRLRLNLHGMQEAAWEKFQKQQKTQNKMPTTEEKLIELLKLMIADEVEAAKES